MESDVKRGGTVKLSNRHIPLTRSYKISRGLLAREKAKLSGACTHAPRSFPVSPPLLIFAPISKLSRGL